MSQSWLKRFNMHAMRSHKQGPHVSVHTCCMFLFKQGVLKQPGTLRGPCASRCHAREPKWRAHSQQTQPPATPSGSSSQITAVRRLAPASLISLSRTF